MKPRRPPRWLLAALCMLLLAAGASLAATISTDPYASSSSTTLTRTLPGKSTVRTIRRVTKGKVITLPSGRKVVHVPLLIIRTDDHYVRVPAHNLRIKRVSSTSSAVAVIPPAMPVTVTIYLPGETPPPVTLTVTSVETQTVTIPTTITLPLGTSAPEE